MDILTKAVSFAFSSRLHKIESFAGKAFEIQDKQLQSLLNTLRHTQWGKTHGGHEITDYQSFSKCMPVVSYEDLHASVEQMMNGEKSVLWTSSVHWYARSSGTTNSRSKHIPVTKEILKKCHYRGGLDSVALYLRNHPESRFFSKKGLILGGSHSPSALNKCAHCGDLSAVLLQNLNPLVNLIRVPDKSIILMDEWEEKIKAIVENTYKKDVGSLSGIPSWMLTLIKEILKKTGKETLNEVWPNLEVFFHGGIKFEPYRDQYNKLIPSEKMHYMETYNASEGFFGIQDDPSDESLLLMLDYGIFYEFIPIKELHTSEHPPIVPLEGVRVNENYAVIITTAGGLWRYNIGDTIRFTSVSPYKFIITGRTKHFINSFGEELMVDNAEKGIQKACAQTQGVVKAYTAAPLFLLDQAKGRHQWLIEFEEQPGSLENFTNKLDSALQALNSDYAAKRYKAIALQKPEIIIARQNLFYDWLKKNGKLGGQHKVPCLSNNREIIEELLEMNK